MSLLTDILEYTQNQTRAAANTLGTSANDTSSQVKNLIGQLLSSQGGATNEMDYVLNTMGGYPGLSFPNQPSAPATFAPLGGNTAELYNAIMKELDTNSGSRAPASMRMPGGAGTYKSEPAPAIKAHTDAVMEQLKQQPRPQVPYSESVFNPQSPEGRTVQLPQTESAQPTQPTQPARPAGQSKIPFDQLTPEQQLQELQAVMTNSDVSLEDGVLTAKGRPVPLTEGKRGAPNMDKVKASMYRFEKELLSHPWSTQVMQGKRAEEAPKLLEAGVDSGFVSSWVEKGAAGISEWETATSSAKAKTQAAEVEAASKYDLAALEQMGRMELEALKARLDVIKKEMADGTIDVTKGWSRWKKADLDAIYSTIQSALDTKAKAPIGEAGGFSMEDDILRGMAREMMAKKQGAQ